MTATIHAADTLETLRSFRDLKGFRHVFLLIDPSAGNEPPASWATHVPADKQWILRGRPAQETDHTSPRLFQLDASLDDVLVDSLRCAGVADHPQDAVVINPAICGWLFARGIAADVPRHLIAAMQQRNVRFEPVLLRYHDPRVLPRLNVILDEEQRQQLLGPIQYWFAVDRFGALVNLQTQPPCPYVPTALSTTAEQWAAIERVEALNRTIAIADQCRGTQLPAGKEADIDVALVRAAEHGLISLEDKVTFAAYCLLTSSDFDQIPDVVAALESCRRGQITLAGALDLLPEQIWKDIAQPSKQTEQQA